MTEKTIRLLVDLTYDPDSMHGDEEEAIEWFYQILFGYDLRLLDVGDIGDIIGFVKVVPQGADRIEELEAKLAKAIEALDEAVYLLAPDDDDMMRQAGVYRIVTTLRELETKP